MKVKLTNVGRGKVCREFELKKYKNFDDAYDVIVNECRKHLMSDEVDLAIYQDNPNKANVMVGGWRCVGEVEVFPDL